MFTLRYILFSRFNILPTSEVDDIPTVFIWYENDRKKKWKKIASVLVYEYNFKLNLTYIWTDIYPLKYSRIAENFSAQT